VAKRPSPPGQSPEDFPQTTPRDLHPTSDIRFVMVEIAKLSTQVARLIEDVDEQSKKLDGIRQQSSYIKGGLAVAVLCLGVFGWFLSQIVEGRLKTVLEALSALQK
jgi:uncharacterized membrane protein YjjP (DUF1212 family)